jgi:capsular polysaccharide biosynthesis protein
MEIALTLNSVFYFDGSESLREIVETFGRASHIAGVHGSSFVNNIFAHAHAKYLEFCPSTRVNHNFYHQYKFLDSYEHILVNADSEHNINLNVNTLLEFYET